MKTILEFLNKGKIKTTKYSDFIKMTRQEAVEYFKDFGKAMKIIYIAEKDKKNYNRKLISIYVTDVYNGDRTKYIEQNYTNEYNIIDTYKNYMETYDEKNKHNFIAVTTDNIRIFNHGISTTDIINDATFYVHKNIYDN